MVIATIGDPIAAGLITSLARPGENIVGFNLFSTELSGKRLELLKEAIPGITRIAVLWNTVNVVAARALKETEAAAKSLGVHLQVVSVQDPGEFERAFGTNDSSAS